VGEEPGPGAKPFLCLIRWNGHLKEGRIAKADFEKIRQWNSGS
jgi:hypothetical protein